MSYLVRKLTQAAIVPCPSPDRRDALGGVAHMSGAVYEVAAEEVWLTGDEVAEGLERRWLHTTDLVMHGGSWSTLGESVAFSEICEPFARREQRLRTIKGALLLLATAVVYGLMFFLRVYLQP